MQRYTIFFIAVSALHVSGGFLPIVRISNSTHSIWYMSGLLAATVNVGELALPAASKPDIYRMLCVHFELLTMGRKTARNM
jgi:hypothetical protein